MGYANVRVAATQTGDTAEKQLVERKAKLTGEVAALGLKIEEAEVYIERIGLAEADCSQVEEELSVLRLEESELLKRIDALSELAEAQRVKSDELDALEGKLVFIAGKVSEAEGVLAGVQEKIRLAENELRTAQQSSKTQIAELNDFIANLQGHAVSLEAKLSSLRVSIEHTNSAFMARSGELQTLQKELYITTTELERARAALTEKQDMIITAEHQLGVLDLALAEKEVASETRVKELHTQLDAREAELAGREGALSDRASMLDSRASKLREIKARLEHHMGVRLPDLIIE